MFKRKAKIDGDKFKVDITNSEAYTKEEAMKIVTSLTKNKENLINQRTGYREAIAKMDKDEARIDSDIAFFKDNFPKEWLNEMASAKVGDKNGQKTE